jgi:hypothetical protein
VVTPTALETLIHMAPGTPRRQEGTAETPMTLTVPQLPRREATAPETLIHTALEIPTHMALGTPPLGQAATALETPTHMALGTPPPGQEAMAATMTAPAATRRVTPWLASSWRRQAACSRAIVW